MGIAGTVKRAVFLDRDGVINRAFTRDGVSHPPDSVQSLEILPGVADALHRLRDAGFRLIVVTNQPDVARRTQTREVVDAINDRLMALLPLDEVRTCYHDDADQCGCRKPRPGLLTRDGSVDCSASVMVGDRARDIDAGRAAGCATVLVGDHYTQAMIHEPDARFPTLADATAWILTCRPVGAPTDAPS